MKKSVFGILFLFLGLMLASCSGTQPSDSTNNSNAPVYTGMTIENDGTMPKAPHKKASVNINGGGSKVINNDITALVNPSFDGDTLNQYYVNRGSDFILSVHFSNPLLYEIQSFTLNETKYSSYMFEAGSTMELILLKIHAPSESGFYEITIDAVKYIDDTTIKNVKMSGEKTIKYGVKYESIPLVENIEVKPSSSSVVFSFTLTDINNLLEPDSAQLYLSDGNKIVNQQKISIGNNNLSFNGLMIDKRYQYGISSVFNSADEKGRHLEWLSIDTFDTLLPFTIENLSEQENSISFSINKFDNLATIESIGIYDDNLADIATKSYSEPVTFTSLKAETDYWFYIFYSFPFDNQTIRQDYFFIATTDIQSFQAKYYDESGTTLLYSTTFKKGQKPEYKGPSISLPSDDEYDYQYFWLLSSGSPYNLYFEDCAFRVKTVKKTKGVEIYNGVVCKYDGSNKTVFIPEYWDGYDVHGLNSYCFGKIDPYDGLVIDKLYLPATMINLPNGDSYVYSDYSDPAFLTIEETFFYSCYSYSNNSIRKSPDTYVSFDEIKKAIFSKVHFLDVDFKEIVNIKEGYGFFMAAFMNCVSIESVELREGITEIYPYMFKNCTSLKNVKIPNGVIDIKYQSFCGCSALEFIEIPDSVTRIEENAFEDCTSLKTINLGNGVKDIQGSAFKNCSSLEHLVIPDSVRTVITGFKGCSKLETVVIGDCVPEIGSSAFFGCSSLKEVTLGKSVKAIGGYSFRECTSLEMISLPDGVESIGMMAFYRSALKTVVIPNSVTTIAKDAFMGTPLTTVFYGGDTASWNEISDGLKNFDSTKIYYYSETMPEESGDYWHYVNDVPTIW